MDAGAYRTIRILVALGGRVSAARYLQHPGHDSKLKEFSTSEYSTDHTRGANSVALEALKLRLAEANAIVSEAISSAAGP